MTWTAQTVSPTAGKSYDISTGLRFATTKTKGNREVTTKLDVNTFFLGITTNTNSVTAGSKF